MRPLIQRQMFALEFPAIGHQHRGIGRALLKEVGRIGLKALVYFEVLSTLALIIGLIAVDWIRPGAGMNIVPTTLAAGSLSSYTATAKANGTVQFLLDIIPTTIVDAFAKGAMLQVILLSILFGIATVQLGKFAAPLVDLLEITLHVLFKIVGLIEYDGDLDSLTFVGRMVVALQNCAHELLDPSLAPSAFKVRTKS